MLLSITDDGREPGWYVSDLCNLISDYCLTWREPLLTYQLYDVVVAIIGKSFLFPQLHCTTFDCCYSHLLSDFLFWSVLGHVACRLCIGCGLLL